MTIHDNHGKPAPQFHTRRPLRPRVSQNLEENDKNGFKLDIHYSGYLSAHEAEANPEWNSSWITWIKQDKDNPKAVSVP